MSDILQIPYEPTVYGKFDTLQIIDDIRIPKWKWGKADYEEPILKDYPEFGKSDATQVVAK